MHTIFVAILLPRQLMIAVNIISNLFIVACMYICHIYLVTLSKNYQKIRSSTIGTIFGNIEDKDEGEAEQKAVAVWSDRHHLLAII